MAFISLNKITPPEPPNDDLVDEQFAISANWDIIDTRLQTLVAGETLTDVEVGQEFINGGKFSVWTGSAIKVMTQYSTQWGAWTPLPLVGGSNFIARTGFPPQYRINTLLRQGELTGGLQFDAAQSAWTHNSTNTVSSASPGALASYTPVASSTQTISTSAITASNDIQGARAILDSTNGWRLRIHFLGASGGGNFVMLDRVRWWF